MTVDLSKGDQGVVSFENGPTFFAMEIERASDDEFLIRWESGWKKRYRRNGEPLSDGARRCISFIPCALDDPRARGLRT